MSWGYRMGSGLLCVEGTVRGSRPEGEGGGGGFKGMPTKCADSQQNPN